VSGGLEAAVSNSSLARGIGRLLLVSSGQPSFSGGIALPANLPAPGNLTAGLRSAG